jgi:hypothetical protein
VNIQRKSNLSNELFQIIILSSPAFGHWHHCLFHQVRPQRPSVDAWGNYLATNDLSATNSLSSVFHYYLPIPLANYATVITAEISIFTDELLCLCLCREFRAFIAPPQVAPIAMFENVNDSYFAHALLYANRRECQAIFFTKDFQRRRPSVRRALNVHPRVTREASAIPELNGNAERAADSPKGEGLNSRKDESCHAIRYHATSTLSNKKKNNLFPCTTSILGYCIHTKRLRQRSNSKGT